MKALKLIKGRLAAAMADKDLPPVVYGGLKREELHRTGSVILHEHYFDALGGNGKAGGSVMQALAASLHNYWCWDHMHGPATATPLIALDMYEHAFHMDYGAAAANYVDASMRNLDWEVVEARYAAVTAGARP